MKFMITLMTRTFLPRAARISRTPIQISISDSRGLTLPPTPRITSRTLPMAVPVWGCATARYTINTARPKHTSAPSTFKRGVDAGACSSYTLCRFCLAIFSSIGVHGGFCAGDATYDLKQKSRGSGSYG